MLPSSGPRMIDSWNMDGPLVTPLRISLQEDGSGTKDEIGSFN